MDFLVEYGYIEWQGSLRKTYNKYIHPDVLDYDSQEMWEMVAKGEVQNLFQFTTDLGKSMAMKTEPRSLIELASANSLMRLATPNEEQPIDRFVRFKNNIEEWYQECREYGLTEEEIKVLEPHLLPVYGQSSTQEDLMEMLMNPKISNFTMEESDVARRGLSKKNEDDIRATKTLYFKKGKNEVGASEELLNYVWSFQIEPQMGYAFNNCHVIPYTTIAVQELNLNYHYPKIFWETSCLAINSGSIEVEEGAASKQTEYGKIAKAIANITKGGTTVLPPDINRADFGFIPDVENNAILFGLKGVHGLGDEVVEEVINNRPYDNLEDFVEKNVYVGSIIKNGHTIQLIKGGAFDRIEDRPREEIMEEYLRLMSEPRENINMQNMALIIEHGLIPEEYKTEYFLYEHRKRIFDKKPHKIIPNNNPKLKKKVDDRHYKIKDKIADFFLEYYSDECIINQLGDGSYIVSRTEMEKEYEKLIEPLRDYIVSSEELLEKYNKVLFMELWNKHAEGSVSKWEMDSLSYYHNEHELIDVDKEQYGIVNFSELERIPEVVGWNYYKDKKFPRHNINRIMGTVLDKNDNKHSITLLTPDNSVVTVKFYGGAFSHYNKQITVPREDGAGNRIAERSWFTRGNKLLIAGFRREDQFMPKTYADSIFRHTVALIKDVNEDGSLKLQSERLYID